jgi:hypothetical protein
MRGWESVDDHRSINFGDAELRRVEFPHPAVVLRSSLADDDLVRVRCAEVRSFAMTSEHMRNVIDHVELSSTTPHATESTFSERRRAWRRLRVEPIPGAGAAVEVVARAFAFERSGLSDGRA